MREPSESGLSATLPARAYHGDGAWRADQRAVLGPGPHILAHVSQVPGVGDAMEVSVAGNSLVVVRGEDNEVRVFHNVCRHRLGPMLWPGERVKGQARLTCRIHGWSYDDHGKLRHAPRFGANTPCLHLVAVPSVTWRGLVVARLEAGTDVPDVSGLEARVGHLQWDALRVRGTASHTLRCNWKVYVENYLEGYHIPWVHPSLAREVDLSRYRVVDHGDCIEHITGKRSEEGVNAGLWVWWWPCTAINVYAEGVCIERIVPVGPTETRIEYLYLFDATVSEAAVTASMEMSAEVTAEDIRVVEAVQKNLEGGAVSEGVLSPVHEEGVRLFQDRVRAAWAMVGVGL